MNFNISYLLAAIHEPEGARHVFETMCSDLIYEEHNNGKSLSKVEFGHIEGELKNLEVNDEKLQYIEMNGTLYPVRTHGGDGGLDIIIEDADNWIVYQCKFFIDGLVFDNSKKRHTQIQNSFDASVKTAKKYNKKIVKWYLCIPINLSNDEREKEWNNFKSANKSKVELIDIIHRPNFSALLRRHKDVFDAYFSIFTPTAMNKMELRKLLIDYKDEIWKSYPILCVPLPPEKLPFLESITYQYRELFNSIDSLFKAYNNEFGDLFNKIDTLSAETQKLKEEFDFIKGDVDHKKYDKFRIKIDKNIEELRSYRDTIESFCTYIKKIIENL
ncbi:hypothetical protein [Niallia sp. FSL R7-0271]|uniref:hypothetical protein n=1 Tax=Niallia sp. FSL R7-0271 TaxID=2921678 RepID=UPI0030F92183